MIIHTRAKTLPKLLEVDDLWIMNFLFLPKEEKPIIFEE